MKRDQLKNTVAALGLAGALLVDAGASTSALAQGRGWKHERRQERREERLERQADRLERERVREELARIRSLDRARQLRYRYNAGSRVVGYYDRFGRFQSVGYYDRAGNFYRYR